jgi:hypothetical protein
MNGTADACVTWASEVRFQQKIGSPVVGVPIPDGMNTTAIYAGGVMKDAPHPDARLNRPTRRDPDLTVSDIPLSSPQIIPGHMFVPLVRAAHRKKQLTSRFRESKLPSECLMQPAFPASCRCPGSSPG